MRDVTRHPGVGHCLHLGVGSRGGVRSSWLWGGEALLLPQSRWWRVKCGMTRQPGSRKEGLRACEVAAASAVQEHVEVTEKAVPLEEFHVRPMKRFLHSGEL